MNTKQFLWEIEVRFRVFKNKSYSFSWMAEGRPEAFLVDSTCHSPLSKIDKVW